MESWYFAYGSNLLIAQMIARTGAAGNPSQPPRIARLADYRLMFEHLEAGEPAFANIRSSGDGVLGVVYRCSEAHLKMLDVYESGYVRQIVTVTDLHGESLSAVAYVIVPELVAATGIPAAEYLERITTGARQHGLPEQYIATIMAISGRSGIVRP